MERLIHSAKQELVTSDCGRFSICIDPSTSVRFSALDTIERCLSLGPCKELTAEETYGTCEASLFCWFLRVVLLLNKVALIALNEPQLLVIPLVPTLHGSA